MSQVRSQSASAIGRHIGFGQGPETKLDMQIIGVVEDTLYEGPREGVHRQAFVPAGQNTFPGSAAFYVRTSLSSESVFGALREQLKRIDPAK